MQNKGFVKVFAVALVVVCLYYLSFSFVTRHYESKAAKMEANDARLFLDSLKNEKVWFGAYTFKQCQEFQIGLGLDLKGGTGKKEGIPARDTSLSAFTPNQEPFL